MKKYGFVYIWYDRKRKMFYVGCHWGFEDDGYICSSDRMRKAYRRRPQDFKRRIIERVYSNREDLFEAEYQWLRLISNDELGNKYYNLKNHKWSHWSALDKESYDNVIEQMSRKIKNQLWYTNGTNEIKVYKDQTPPDGYYPGRSMRHSDEAKQSNREKHVGKTASPETKKILSEIVQKRTDKGLNPFSRRPDGTSVASDRTAAGLNVFSRRPDGSSMGRDVSEQRMKDGTHIFLDPEFRNYVNELNREKAARGELWSQSEEGRVRQSEIQKTRMENKTHNWSDKEEHSKKSKQIVANQLANGTHTSQKPESLEIVSKKQKEMVKNGTHVSQIKIECPICHSMIAKTNFSRHFKVCKEKQEFSTLPV